MADRFESVWDAIGRTPEEVSLLKAKTTLMRAIEERIREKGWTQAEAARALGVHQPRVSDLMRGRLSAFSLDILYAMAETLGLRPELSLSSAA